jgi:hypothetical protein
MKDTKWPYVAGILDGEGTICLYHIKNRQGYQHSGLQVIIYGTSLNLMKYLIANFGGKYYMRSKTSLSKKVQYAWHPSGRKNREKFLLGTLPYLVIKKEQAKLALEFLRIGDQVKDPDYRAKLIARCQSLNKEEPATTNTLDDSFESMIESDLTGDSKSDPVVTQEP